VFLDDQKIFINLQENIETCQKECLSIEEHLLEIERILAAGMQRTASIMVLDVKKLSSEASKQANLAMHSQDPSMAK
jgi:hypothetical protein